MELPDRSRPGFEGRGRITPYPNGYKQGRPKGRKNRITRQVKEALMLAVEQAGMPQEERDAEGNLIRLLPTGKDGMVGYLLWLALNEPKCFGYLLSRIIPVEVKAEVHQETVVYETVEDVRQAMIERGMPVQRLLGARNGPLKDVTPLPDGVDS